LVLLLLEFLIFLVAHAIPSFLAFQEFQALQGNPDLL